MRSRVLRLIVLSCVALFAAHAGAQQAPPTGDPQTVRQYAMLQQELLERFAAKDYVLAAEICQKQIELLPKFAEPHYNLACALARQGQAAGALLELEQAVKLGFTDASHMREDDDLASLRAEAKFKDLAKAARQKELDAPHEKGEEIAGLKMVEGYPEGGLRYRLRIDPAASAAKPARLIVWLHPSGGSMDAVVEALAPQFARNGYALLVFSQKNYSFWSDEDARALEKTLPEVGKVDGVDATRPILLGFSAGGQMALQLWSKNPSAFGGLVLDAAYPIDPVKYERGEVAVMDLPDAAAIRKVPVFVVVGASDGGSRLWRAVEKPWARAGVPLSVQYIRGAGHSWLFNAAQIALLSDWLKSVAAGELPASTGQPHHAPAPGEEDEEPVKVQHLMPTPPAAAYHRL